VRIEPEWTFTEVRRAALALAREIERRMPGKATSKWCKEERVGVFLAAGAAGVAPGPGVGADVPEQHL